MRWLDRWPLLLLVALLAWCLPACSGGQVKPGDVADHVARNEALYKAAVQLGTLKVLEKNPTLAPRVREIADQAAAGVAAGEVVPLTVLEAQARAAVRWDKLKPEEVILVDALLATVRQELERATAGVTAPEDVRVVVAKVLGWVSAASALAQPPVATK